MRSRGGGASVEVEALDEAMVFRGELSLEQKRGSATVRSREADYDLSGFTAVACRVKGDGKSYKLGLRTEPGPESVLYQARFTAPAQGWMEIVFPFEDFVAYRRGWAVTAPPLDPGRIRSFELFIADEQEGPFRLEFAHIRAVRLG